MHSQAIFFIMLRKDFPVNFPISKLTLLGQERWGLKIPEREQQTDLEKGKLKKGLEKLSFFTCHRGQVGEI